MNKADAKERNFILKSCHFVYIETYLIIAKKGWENQQQQQKKVRCFVSESMIMKNDIYFLLVLRVLQVLRRNENKSKFKI